MIRYAKETIQESQNIRRSAVAVERRRAPNTTAYMRRATDVVNAR